MMSNWEQINGKISTDKFTGTIAQREYARDILTRSLIADEHWIERFERDIIRGVKGVDVLKIKQYKERKELSYQTLISIIEDGKKIKSKTVIENWKRSDDRPGGGTLDRAALMTEHGFTNRKN